MENWWNEWWDVNVVTSRPYVLLGDIKNDDDVVTRRRRPVNVIELSWFIFRLDTWSMWHKGALPSFRFWTSDFDVFNIDCDEMFASHARGKTPDQLFKLYCQYYQPGHHFVRKYLDKGACVSGSDVFYLQSSTSSLSPLSPSPKHELVCLPQSQQVWTIFSNYWSRWQEAPATVSVWRLVERRMIRLVFHLTPILSVLYVPRTEDMLLCCLQDKMVRWAPSLLIDVIGAGWTRCLEWLLDNNECLCPPLLYVMALRCRLGRPTQLSICRVLHVHNVSFRDDDIVQEAYEQGDATILSDFQQSVSSTFCPVGLLIPPDPNWLRFHRPPSLPPPFDLDNALCRHNSYHPLHFRNYIGGDNVDKTYIRFLLTQSCPLSLLDVSIAMNKMDAELVTVILSFFDAYQQESALDHWLAWFRNDEKQRQFIELNGLESIPPAQVQYKKLI